MNSEENEPEPNSIEVGEASDEMEDKIAQLENRDTDDEGEIDPSPIRSRREQKQDLDSTDEDDFIQEENKRDATVELNDSSDDEEQ